MNLRRLRQQIAAGRVRIEFTLPHALTEAAKDGLTVAELRAAVLTGEAIKDRLAGLIARLHRAGANSLSCGSGVRSW